MKRKALMPIILTLALVAAGFTVYATANNSFLSKLSKEKRENYLAHEAKVNAAEEKAAKNTVKQTLDAELKKNSETNEVSAYDQAGKIEDIETPGAQVPMHSIDLKKYNFTNRGFTLYNLAVAGSSIDNPETGVIINFYTDPKTGKPSSNVIKIPNVGKVTLIEVSNDKKTITFKTSNGKFGIFDGTTDRKGSYTIK